MLFSIIIPVHNVDAYVGECLDSIINQPFSNYEIIIVENNSTDKSYETVCKYRSDSRVKLIQTQEIGPSAARNIGYKNASGDYLWFVDGDDRIEAGALDFLKKKLYEYDNPDILIFNYAVLDCNGLHEADRVCLNGEVERKEAVNGLFNPKKWSGFVWNKLFRRNAIEKINGRFDPNLFMIEDLVYTTHFMLNCKKIAYTNECLYHYRKREGSISTSFNEKKLTAFDAYEILLSDLGSHPDYTEARTVIQNAKCDFSRWILCYYYKTDRKKYINIKGKYKDIIKRNQKSILNKRAKVAAILVRISPCLVLFFEGKQNG